VVRAVVTGFAAAFVVAAAVLDFWAGCAEPPACPQEAIEKAMTAATAKEKTFFMFSFNLSYHK